MKRELLWGILAAALITASPAFSQMNPPASSAPPMRSDQGTNMPAGDHSKFISREAASDWRASKLIGTNVMGPDNKKVGDINDVLLDSSGSLHAVVIGVGGLAGIGEKDVAVPLSALTLTRSMDNTKIDSVKISYSADELKNAPAFEWANSSAQYIPPAKTAPSNPPARSAPAR